MKDANVAVAIRGGHSPAGHHLESEDGGRAPAGHHRGTGSVGQAMFAPQSANVRDNTQGKEPFMLAVPSCSTLTESRALGSRSAIRIAKGDV